ncbi:ORF6N domain protein [Candidatus Kuenenia stuttgartiensis]|uniref:ORF6N domain protein n=2 Tax=Candidatus Brocadiaceae TaxID=1127830 RepID=A0A2C9CH43_KUEST|nr:ORF6N domain protein [Candidatus Kuenenia stuttgartiensis]
MLDRDLAVLYDVETRAINQAVKRNMGRFPTEFCFQLSDEEFENWKSQIVISNEDKMGLRRPPYAFTEQGVAMLSAVLRSETAVKVSVNIMKAFIAMRRFLTENAYIFKRIDTIEQKQIRTDSKVDENSKKIETVLNAIEAKALPQRQGIFYEGQVFDAYTFVSDLIRSAKSSIILIDNYIDESILTFFTKKKRDVTVTIYTKKILKQFALDIKKFNEQYPLLSVKEFSKSHDRFLIIDEDAIYHIGASLKDLGKKWFAFSKMEFSVAEMLMKIKGQEEK